MMLDNWWRGKCKSCKHYAVEVEDSFEKGDIFPGLGYCHFKSPCVLMSPEGKPISVWPETNALEFCGSYQESELIQFQQITNGEDQNERQNNHQD